GIVFTVIGTGFAVAKCRTAFVAAPVLTYKIGYANVAGIVTDVDRLPGRVRIVLADPVIERLSTKDTPARLRVSLTKKSDVPSIGARISLRAYLSPPPPPVAPGAYDFRRHAYFDRLGAVGYAVSRPEEITPPVRTAFNMWTEHLRQSIIARLNNALPSERAAVAAALLTGERREVPKERMEAVRKSGLAHLLAISGLHVGLVAGLVFFLVRAVLAVFERTALRHSIKKWSAVAAFLAAFAFMLLVGAPVPTQRAVLMTALVLIGVLVDRVAITMRVVALAATVILLFQPEELAGPSFQMSFAAVIALVAAFEARRRFLRMHSRGIRGPGKIVFKLAGIAFASAVAALATAPFAIYHFQRVAMLGVLANLAAVPLTGFVIMPSGLLALVLMPVGLEYIPLRVMGAGIGAMIAVAEKVSALPGSFALVPSIPAGALVLFVLGTLILVLVRVRWRLIGLVPVASALLWAHMTIQPDILIGRDGNKIALRGSSGQILINTARMDGYVAETWIQ
ncbi:MAG: ComEC/Rec2 family competence protein, partial [Pseudomonadota bacterium]|nr:ComEC/Rec2 family competence protein [Pseudomonadota bacterium]